MEHPEGTEAARITELAQQFHSIANLGAVKSWDANALNHWAAFRGWAADPFTL